MAIDSKTAHERDLELEPSVGAQGATAPAKKRQNNFFRRRRSPKAGGQNTTKNAAVTLGANTADAAKSADTTPGANAAGAAKSTITTLGANTANNTNVPQDAGAPKGAGNVQTAKNANTAPNTNNTNSAPNQSNANNQNRANANNGANGRKKQEKPGKALRIIPLGGLNEVGKNITMYEYGEDRIIVDCGLVFPDDEMYGVDLVIPDFSYIIKNKAHIHGIVITHGHEDHIGALPYLLKEVKLPVYATRLTVGLIENKLAEHGLKNIVKINVIKPRDRLSFGAITVVPIHVNHSIPDAVALAIETPTGTVIQTGDFKMDYTPPTGEMIDLSTFGEYGKRGVLALLSDSTNAERPGYSMSERKVGESFEVLFNRAEKQRIIIATFASNLYRVQQIIDMAVKHGRKVAVSGRSMVNNTEMAFELGYLKASKDVIVDVTSINKYPPEKLVIVTTGSQGEPLSALARMAGGTHRNVNVGAGDFIIISATPIPGNEKTVGKVINGLLKSGADVIYESMYDVHTSGHAYQDELKLMLSLVKPRFFMPVHGEYKQLKKHAMLAESVGIDKKNILIADIGDVVEVTKQSIKITDKVTAGKMLVDGLGIGDVGNVVLRDRRHLSQDGLVIVVASMDSATGELLSGPDIVSRGFVYVKESDSIIEEAKERARVILSNFSGEKRLDMGTVKNKVREQLSEMLYQKTKRSPMILPVIMEI